MRFEIDDKVRLQFSEERLQNEIFEMADGLTATVVERYSQAYMPEVELYEVELDQPIEKDKERIVVISGLLEKDLSPIERTNENRVARFGDFSKKKAELKHLNESISWDNEGKFTWDDTDERYIFRRKLKRPALSLYGSPETLPQDALDYIEKKFPDRLRTAELGVIKGFAVEDISIVDANLVYHIEPRFDDLGLSSVEFSILKIEFTVEIEIWDLEADDQLITWEVELVDDKNLFDVGRYEVEMGKMPYYPEDLEINMGKSWDPAKFTYTIEVGQR